MQCGCLLAPFTALQSASHLKCVAARREVAESHLASSSDIKPVGAQFAKPVRVCHLAFQGEVAGVETNRKSVLRVVETYLCGVDYRNHDVFRGDAACRHRCLAVYGQRGELKQQVGMRFGNVDGVEFAYSAIISEIEISVAVGGHGTVAELSVADVVVVREVHHAACLVVDVCQSLVGA